MSKSDPTRVRHFTPPEIADRYGVSPHKVAEWIRDGELSAINLARRDSSRPRYSISPAAIDAFERERTVVSERDKPIARVRRRQTPNVKKFF